MISLAKTTKVPNKTPAEIPTHPNINKVDTTLELASEIEKETEEKLIQFKANDREGRNEQVRGKWLWRLVV